MLKLMKILENYQSRFKDSADVQAIIACIDAGGHRDIVNWLALADAVRDANPNIGCFTLLNAIDQFFGTEYAIVYC